MTKKVKDQISFNTDRFSFPILKISTIFTPSETIRLNLFDRWHCLRFLDRSFLSELQSTNLRISMPHAIANCFIRRVKTWFRLFPSTFFCTVFSFFCLNWRNRISNYTKITFEIDPNLSTFGSIIVPIIHSFPYVSDFHRCQILFDSFLTLSSKLNKLLVIVYRWIVTFSNRFNALLNINFFWRFNRSVTSIASNGVSLGNDQIYAWYSWTNTFRTCLASDTRHFSLSQWCDAFVTDNRLSSKRNEGRTTEKKPERNSSRRISQIWDVWDYVPNVVGYQKRNDEEQSIAVSRPAEENSSYSKRI